MQRRFFKEQTLERRSDGILARAAGGVNWKKGRKTKREAAFARPAGGAHRGCGIKTDELTCALYLSFALHFPG